MIHKLHVILLSCAVTVSLLVNCAYANGWADKRGQCLKPPCLRKCCPSDQVWDFVKATCKSTVEGYHYNLSGLKTNFSAAESVSVGQSCPEGSELMPQEKEPADFTWDFANEGQVIINGRTLRDDEYCVDNVHSDGIYASVLFICTFKAHREMQMDDVEGLAILEKIHLKKCCTGGHVLSLTYNDCIAVNDTAHLWPPKSLKGDGNATVTFNPDNFHITHELLTCPSGYIPQQTKDFHFHEDGSISVGSLNEILQPGNFCIEATESTEISFVARYCIEDPCKNGTICVKKCCPAGYIYQVLEDGKQSCIASDVIFQPYFGSPQEPNVTLTLNVNDYVIKHGFKPNCTEDGYNLINPDMYENEKFFLLRDSGNLFITGYVNVVSDIAEYCIDDFHMDSKLSQKALICFPPTVIDTALEVVLATYPIFLFISTFFLIITFVVYAILPELHNIHGLTTMCLVLCMIVTFVGLGIIQTSSNLAELQICKSTAIVVHYFFLAIFTWLSVMGFDIWLTFSTRLPDGQSVEFWLSTLMPARQSLEFPRPLKEETSFSRAVDYDNNEDECHKNSSSSEIHSSQDPIQGNLRVRSSSSYDRKKARFRLYSIYAWLVPLIIVITGQLLDNLPNVPHNIIKPGFGTIKCWFQDNWGLFCYFYGPIGVICIANIVFFIMTAIKLYQTGRDTAFATQNSNPRERFRVILYLFVLTGVLWILEVLSFVVKGSPYIWIIPDIVNICTGIFIFVIFVCKPKVIQLLRKRVGCFNSCCEKMIQWKRSCTRESIVPNRSLAQSTSQSTEDTARKTSTTLCTHVTNDSNSSTSTEAQDKRWC